MVEADVDTVVAASTNGVFGWDWLGSHPEAVKYLPLDEEHPIYTGGFSYNLSKALDEGIFAGFNRRSGMQIYGIRPGWVWRPEAQKKLAENMGPATAWQPNFFNYVDVRDLARAFRQCLEAAGDIESSYELFCITAADTRAEEDSKDLVEKFQPGFADKAANLVGRQSMISSAKAKKYFGYEAQHSWTEYL
jgi:nucleoside-diphosphate-sugar epimerase